MNFTGDFYPFKGTKFKKGIIPNYVEKWIEYHLEGAKKGKKLNILERFNNWIRKI